MLRVEEVGPRVVSNALGAVAEQLGGVHELQELVIVAVESAEVGDVALRELWQGGVRGHGARADVGRVALLVAHRDGGGSYRGERVAVGGGRVAIRRSSVPRPRASESEKGGGSRS